MNDFAAQFGLQWKATCRNLFDRQMSGHRFEPPLPGDLSDDDVCKLLSGGTGHNRDSIVFRDSQMRTQGIKLFCQCQNCVLAQAEFVLSLRSEIVGQGANSISVTFDSDDMNSVVFISRDRSLLEEQAEARRAAERQVDLQEKQELRSAITKLERRVSDIVAETRGLVRDNSGRLWTRRDLASMSQSQAQQLEPRDEGIDQ